MKKQTTIRLMYLWLITAMSMLFASVVGAQTLPINGYCILGGTQSITSGLKSSNFLQGVIPNCTVTVYLTGTTNLATIYKDSTNAPLANPFKATTIQPTQTGQWLFYASTAGAYDVVLSGGIAPNTYPSPVTLIALLAGGGGGGGVTKIVAGANVTISPTNGLGTVTINSTGGSGGGSFGICDAQTQQTDEQNGISNCYNLPAVQTIAGPDYPNTEPPFYGPNFTRLQDLRGGHVINVQHGSPNGTGVLNQNLFNTQTSPQNNGFFSPSSQVTTAEGFGNGNGFAGGQSAISNVQYPIGGSVYCYFIGLCSANATVQTWAGSEDHIGSPGYSYIYHGAPCVGSGRECDKWGAGNYFEFPLVGVGTVDSVVNQTRIHLTPCQSGKCTGGQEIAGGVAEDLDDTINMGLITALENYGSYPASFVSSTTHTATPNYMQTTTTLAPAQVAVPGSPQVVTLTRSVSQVTATAGSGQTPGTYTVNGTGGGGTGAQIAVTVDATGIVSSQVRVTNSGQNYTSAPTFTFSHGGTPSTFTVSVGGYLPTSGEACVIGKEHYEENVYSSSGPITGFSITGNVITVTSVLGFQVGDTPTFGSFATSTYLNGQTVTISGITNSVSGITLGFGGSGGSGQTPGTYLVTGTGGGGSGAQVSIVVGANGQVNTDPTIVNPGSGYTSAPTFTVGAGGVGATFFVSLLANQFTAPFTHANVAPRVEAGIFTLPAATGGHQEIVLTSRYSNSPGTLILPGSLVAVNLEAEKHFLQFSGINSWPYYLSCNAGPDTSHVWYSFPDGSTDAEGILGIVGSGIPVDSAFIFPPQTMSGINITSIPSTGVSKVAINFGGGGSISGKYTLDVTGGGGSGAIVTVIVTADGNIQNPPVVVNPGTGYTSLPTFTLPSIASGFPATFFVTLGGSQVTATLPFPFVGPWLQGAPSSSVASCADTTVNYTNQAASLNVTSGNTIVTWITPTAHANGTTTGCTIAVTGQNGYEMHPMADVLSITNPDIAPGFNPADPDYHPEIDGTLMLSQNLVSWAGKSTMLPHAPRVAITHTQTFNQITPGPTNFQSIVLDAGTVSGLNPIFWQCVTCDPTQFVGGGGFRPPGGTLMTTSSIPFLNYFHIMAPVLGGTVFQVDAPLGNKFDDTTYGIFRFAGAGNFGQADISYNPGTNRLSVFADWFDVRGFGIDTHGGEVHQNSSWFQNDAFELHYLGNGNVFGETDFSGGPGVFGAGFFRVPSTGGFQWASALIDTNPDTQLCRDSAGAVAFGTTGCNRLGSIFAFNQTLGGTLNLAALTASSLLCTDGSKNVTTTSCASLGGVTSINGTGGAFTFTGSGVSCTTTTCTFSGAGSGIGIITWALPSILTASPTTISASGTQTFSLATQSANTVFAGPTTGSAASPTFRSLVVADVPTLNQNTTGNAATATALASTPTLCSTGNAPTGILANGNATGCAAIGGGSGISGLTAGFIPLAGSATTITANSPLDYAITTAGVLTSSKPIQINDTTDPGFIGLVPNGIAPAVQAGAAGWGIGATLTTAGYYKMPDAPGSGVWTATNSSGIVTNTFTPLNGSGAGVVTGPSSASSGHLTSFTGTLGQVADSGVVAATLGQSTWTFVSPTALATAQTIQLTVTSSLGKTFIACSVSNCVGTALAAATGSTTLTLFKNGTSFCVATYAASATTATFSTCPLTTFAQGDVFKEIYSGDATLIPSISLVTVN